MQEDRGSQWAHPWAGRPLYEIEAWSLLLEAPDADDSSAMKVLLDTDSFKALPGVILRSWAPRAGQDHLGVALNGYLLLFNRIVRINGEDLYNIYDNLLRVPHRLRPQEPSGARGADGLQAVKYSAKFSRPPAGLLGGRDLTPASSRPSRTSGSRG